MRRIFLFVVMGRQYGGVGVSTYCTPVITNRLNYTAGVKPRLFEGELI